MANSDFAFLPFYEHLGDNKSDIPMTKLPFMGLSSSVKRFNIEGNPLNGYVLVKVGGIQHFDAEILKMIETFQRVILEVLMRMREL
jgi:hypothetical protein